MPGQPKLQALEAYMQEEGREDQFWDMIAAGEPMKDIAARFRGFLKEAPEFPSRQFMYHWIRNDEDRHEFFKKLRKAQADDVFDQVHDLLFPDDDADLPASSFAVNLLKQRRQYLEKRAAQFAPEDYSENQTQKHEVNLNLGGLYLEELRNRGSMPARDEPEAIEADYEVEDADRQALPADS